MARAGFCGIDVQVITRPDTDGRLLPMIKNMAEYARASGKINHGPVDVCAMSAIAGGPDIERLTANGRD